MSENYYYTDGLEGERIVTRLLTINDVGPWSAFFEDKESMLYIPDFGFDTSEEKAGHMIARQLDRYGEKRYGLQGIIEKSSGELLGMCGLLLQEVDGVKELEIGYHLLKKNWGRGYATEAAKLFKKFAAQHRQKESVISIIDVGNTRSQKVAERNGLKLETQKRWMELDVYIYRVKLNG